MSNLGLRSPFVKVGGLVHFARMLDKIRAHAKGELPADYQANLGRGFDASCVAFLRVDYNQLVERMKKGGTDEEILRWCFKRAGSRPKIRFMSGMNLCASEAGTTKSMGRSNAGKRKPAWLAARKSRRCSPLLMPMKGAR